VDKPCLRGIDCLAYTPFLHSLERRMERIVIDAGRTRLRAGVRHEAAARAFEVRMRSAPGVGGTFQIQVFIQPSSPETRCESFLVVMAAVGAEMGWACFWLTCSGKSSAA
jgi:hypothetical protein